MVATGQLSKPLLETLPTVFHLQLVRHTSPVFSALAQLICIPQNLDELHWWLCGAWFPGQTLGVCLCWRGSPFPAPTVLCLLLFGFPTHCSLPSIHLHLIQHLLDAFLAIVLGFFLLALHKMMALERWLGGVQLFQGVPLKAKKVAWKIQYLGSIFIV